MKRMNKTLLIALSLLGLMALMQGRAQAQPVSRETACRAATTFLNANGAKTAQLTDVSAEIGFANLYVFTTDQSFVILSADSRVQPVLGYSLNDPFVAEDMPENKRAWIEEYGDAIQFAIERQTRASAETAQQWRDLAEGNYNRSGSVVVGPLVQTRWDQYSPYNLLCPSGTVTGCVATAMAQIMKYWNYPEHGIGSHSYIYSPYGVLSADFGSTDYDWDNMTNTYGSSSTEMQRQAVATLMYHCGVSVDMKYGPASTGGSGASTPNVANALKSYFNYSSDVQHIDRDYSNDNAWVALLKAELDSSRPIQYHGSGSGGGHSFVCDGYRDDDYFHFNWGWSGSCDEYYTLNTLNPGPGGTGSGAYGIYNDGQGAIIGIHPSICAAEEPSNLTLTLNERQVTLFWDAANGAASYNVYCNGFMVGDTTATSFVHVAPFGNSTYFVRSVDNNGVLSLSSNTVSVTVDYQSPIVTDLSATVIGNSVHLEWTTPEWCYPATPTETLAYGTLDNSGTSLGYQGSACMYWGHRYPASSLTNYNRMAVYKVSFLARETGDYQLFVYQGTTDDHPQTQLLQQSFTLETSGWNEIDLSTPIQIDASRDLWVFLYDPEYRDYPAAYCAFEGDEGNYYSNHDPTLIVSSFPGIAFFIRTYLTDGAYTYNLYRNDESIANAIPDPHYTDSGLADGTYTYHLTTNYYGGETSPSNSVTVTVPGLVTQTVELSDSWTWWTPTVETTLSELETALGGNGILINSQDGGFVRYENGRWNGTLLDFEPGQMYRIKTQEASTITLTGAPVNQVSINILPGYNWFGYTGLANLTLANALDNFTPNENDQIIGQEGTATFSNGQWSGTLSSLEPGKGYIYYSTSSNTKTIRFE